jgi:glutaredoxin
MRYILFTRDNCPFCVEAQALLEQKGLDYKTVNFTPEQSLILKEVKEAYQWNTVPMIFQREGAMIEFIGGYTDLEKLLTDE